MTKVQIRFALTQELTSEILQRIGDAHAVYGINRIEVSESGKELTVDYDATRLRPPEVLAALRNCAIPVD